MALPAEGRRRERRQKYRKFREQMEHLINRLEAQDRYTKGHSMRVRTYALMLADRLGVNPRDREYVSQAAMLHDIAKLSITQQVLQNQGRLNQRQVDKLAIHPIIGALLAARIGASTTVCLGIMGHHQRWDGRNIESMSAVLGVSGKRIHAIARIICICDSFDAMTTQRSYNQAMTKEAASLEILSQAGKQFDPVMAEVFVREVVPQITIDPSLLRPPPHA